MISFSLKRGDTWAQSFAWKSGTESGDPIDLTGATVRLQLRDLTTRGLTDTLIFEADQTQCLTVNGVNGVVNLLVPASATVNFPVGRLQFDLELTYTDGTVQSTETMLLKVIEDITTP